MKLFCLIFLLFLIQAKAFCQFQAQSFSRNTSIKVIENGDTLKNPWVGGHNFCQLSPIDLNNDGIKDLFVFDMTGNKITTYINGGTPNKVDYTYAPEYISSFPSLSGWVLLKDYNCDGKEDIFTLNAGGIRVYLNESNAEGLKFTLISDKILTDYGQGKTNIYGSINDFPAFSDVDNDGDLDVLGFPPAGGQLEYHKNQSMELYGNCDSLTFLFETGCWGYFTENSVTNDITLNTTCPRSSGGQRHASSTLLAFDPNKDGKKDLLMGDISFSNAVFVLNGGTPDSARIVYQDNQFPSYDIPVNTKYLPAFYYLDVNNDNKSDLLVSPFASNISENYNSIHYYKNAGVNADTFRFQQQNFLIDEMIDVGEGAYPVFFDYDSDGKEDIVIGNYGYYSSSGTYPSQLALYRNKGSNFNPVYELVTKDFGGFSTSGLKSIAPAFGDLDGDGDADMVIGEMNGTITYYQNTAGAGNIPVYSLSSFGATIDVGLFSMPQLIDVNRDGKLDLLIGERNGTLNYIENTGTINSPVFTTIKENFGGINVTNTAKSITGYSAPFMYDSNGKYKLIIGSEDGTLFLYDNIDGNLNGNFNLVTKSIDLLNEGTRVAPYGKDLNGDGFIELLVGNYSGGVSFFNGIAFNNVVENKDKPIELTLYPNPAGEVLKGRTTDGQQEKNISIFNFSGSLVHHQKFTGNDFEIDTRLYPPGFYTLQLSSENTITTKKFVILK